MHHRAPVASWVFWHTYRPCSMIPSRRNADACILHACDVSGSEWRWVLQKTRLFVRYKFECGWLLEIIQSKRHGLIQLRSISFVHSGIVSISAGISLRKGLGSFLSFVFFSFSFLSLLDLESLGILLSLLARLSVLRLSSGGNLVSLGVLLNLDVQVVRSGW
jgi:hypothetical protein